MRANENISRTESPYPAPVSFYGKGWFYKPEWVEHARQLNDGCKNDNPATPAFQVQQGPVDFRIVPFTGDPAKIPTKGRKTCVVCGEPFTPIVGKQLTCGMRCSQARSKQKKLAWNANQKVKVS